jgi:5-methylcytosine-specific restriction protein A
MSSALFVPGQLYHRRTDIHGKFKGQERGGMITPAAHNLVLLVTGDSGRQHGYEDKWSDDGNAFLYYGEGQIGDMQFTKGNLALRDHSANGKDVHLFKAVPRKKGWLEYVGQMVLDHPEWVDAPDSKGSIRKAIRFHLIPVEAFAGTMQGEPMDAPEDRQLRKDTLDQLRRKALADAADARTPSQRQAIYRRRSRAIRLYVLRRSEGNCEGCGKEAPFMTSTGDPYLEPHHIRRLTDGGPDHPRWVIAVCPNCHRRAHYAQDSQEYNLALTDIVGKKET